MAWSINRPIGGRGFSVNCSPFAAFSVIYRLKISGHHNLYQFQIGTVRAGLVSDEVARLREGAPQ